MQKTSISITGVLVFKNSSGLGAGTGRLCKFAPILSQTIHRLPVSVCLLIFLADANDIKVTEFASGTSDQLENRCREPHV